MPDGVFFIHDSEQEKSVLFFLEVDMGTETLADPQREGKDLRQKIANYRALYRSGEYEVFGRTWKMRFVGFRTLFLTNNSERLVSVCRLVRELAPADFVWVTDQSRMFRQGSADSIWARGGDLLGKPPESILNSRLACPSPLPQVLP